MNEFSQATLLDHVYKKVTVNLCKFSAIERDALVGFITNKVFLQLAFAYFIIAFSVRLVG